MSFTGVLINSRSPQVSRILPSNLAIVTNVVIIISLLVSSYYLLTPVLFHWSLSYSMLIRASRILLSILADVNNSVDWIVWIYSPISNSSSLLSKPIRTVPRIPIIICITVMFHSFSFIGMIQVLVYLFAF